MQRSSWRLVITIRSTTRCRLPLVLCAARRTPWRWAKRAVAVAQPVRSPSRADRSRRSRAPVRPATSCPLWATRRLVASRRKCASRSCSRDTLTSTSSTGAPLRWPAISSSLPKALDTVLCFRESQENKLYNSTVQYSVHSTTFRIDLLRSLNVLAPDRSNNERVIFAAIAVCLHFADALHYYTSTLYNVLFSICIIF